MRKRKFGAACLFVTLLAAGADSALALDPGPPRGATDPTNLGPARPGTAPGLPDYAPQTLAPLRLPPIKPDVGGSNSLASGIRIFVREYHISGSTVFTADELAAITAPYTNREVTTEDLEGLRQALTLYYVEHGMINSGAIIPDQQVTDGVVELAIVEGRLTQVEVSGNHRLGARYVSDRLSRAAGPPFDVTALQEQLQLILSGPFVKRINAELAPGEKPGDAILKAHIEENRPFDLSGSVNNDVTPSLGEVRGVLHGTLYSPLGLGDIANAELGYAEGSKEAQVGYALPLNSRGTTLEVLGDWSLGEVIEERLSKLDIQGKTASVGVRVSHPLWESARERLGLSAGLDVRHSETSLLGRGFAFSPGVAPDGDSQVSVLRFTQDWVQRGPAQVIAISSTFSVGVDVLGATHHQGDIPDGRFFVWLGQAQWARRLKWADSQIIFRLDGQWTPDPLLPLEQFAVGGSRTVRGYAKNLLVRDRGFATSLELRVPLLHTAAGLPLLEFAPFVDAGGAWFKGREGPSPNVVPAIGVGFRCNPHRKLHADLYWGHALKNIADAGDSPQEDGIYFNLTADVFR